MLSNYTLCNLLQVVLEKVIGLTANTNAQIALDRNTGVVAYAAGYVLSIYIYISRLPASTF